MARDPTGLRIADQDRTTMVPGMTTGTIITILDQVETTVVPILALASLATEVGLMEMDVEIEVARVTTSDTTQQARIEGLPSLVLTTVAAFFRPVIPSLATTTDARWQRMH